MTGDRTAPRWWAWAAAVVMWLCPWLLPLTGGLGFVACCLAFMIAAVVALSVFPEAIHRKRSEDGKGTGA